MADYLRDKYYPFGNPDDYKPMISKQEALHPTLMEEAAREKEMTRRRTENPRLAEDTVVSIPAYEKAVAENNAELERAARILTEGLGMGPPEVVRPVGELAERYVGIKKMIDELRAKIAAAVEDANKIGAELERHYGMRVPKLIGGDTVTEVASTELPQSEDGRPYVAPVQTTVAQIRADAQMGGADENSFQNNVAASLQNALRALK